MPAPVGPVRHRPARWRTLCPRDGKLQRVIARSPLMAKIKHRCLVRNVVTTGITAKKTRPAHHHRVSECFPFRPGRRKGHPGRRPTGTEIELANATATYQRRVRPGRQTVRPLLGDQASPDSGDEAVPFTGKILLVNADGTLTPIVDGLMLGTSLDITGDTALRHVADRAGSTRSMASRRSHHCPPPRQPKPPSRRPRRPAPAASPRRHRLRPRRGRLRRDTIGNSRSPRS